MRRRAAAKGGTTFDEVGAEDQIAAIRVQKSMLVRKGGVERGVVFHIHFILHTSCSIHLTLYWLVTSTTPRVTHVAARGQSTRTDTRYMMADVM